MRVTGRRARASVWALVAVALSASCGAKTGLDASPRDGGGDNECDALCPGSTFCAPLCQAEGGCEPLSAPDCDDDDPCTEDRCDPVTDACAHEVTFVDLDLDLALAPIECGGTDCDDEDSAIFPGAPERCNGIDDDCDALIDEEADLLPWGEEVAVAASEQTDDAAALAWTGEGYVYGFWDYRDGDADVYLQRLTPEGEAVGEQAQVTTSAGDGYGPALVWTERELGVVWSDRRDGNFEIYFARFDGELRRLTGDIRVTDDDAWSLYPVVVWSGREYLVAWQDERDGQFETYAQRIGPGGPVGAATRLSDAGAVGATAESPVAAFDGERYHVAWLEGWLDAFEVRHEVYDQLLAREQSIVVTEALGGSATAPAIAAAPTAAAVVWEQETAGLAETMAAVITPEGALASGPARVSPAGVVARDPDVLWDNNGFVVVLSAYALASNGFDLAYLVLDPTGAESHALTAFVTAEGDQVGASVTLGAGEVGIAWSDMRGGTYDAYFTRLLCAGL